MMQKFRTSACLIVTATVKMLGVVAFVLVIGAVIALAGAALLFNAGGAADFVMRNVTRRNLGTLAPGFAASPEGFRVYARMVAAIGVFFLGIAVAERYALLGVGMLAGSLIVFVFLSVIAIRGEIATYRALKR
jgi:hypothetical protein